MQRDIDQFKPRLEQVAQFRDKKAKLKKKIDVKKKTDVQEKTGTSQRSRMPGWPLPGTFEAPTRSERADPRRRNAPCRIASHSLVTSMQ